MKKLIVNLPSNIARDVSSKLPNKGEICFPHQGPIAENPHSLTANK